MTPTPKFETGQKVYLADVEGRSQHRTCPDCNDTGKWRVITQVDEFEVECRTCEYGHYPEPDLYYIPRVRAMTIGSVRIDTYDYQHPVSYMMIETGVGSGTIHKEERVFLTEAQAEAGSIPLVEARNADIEQQKEQNAERRRKQLRRPYQSISVENVRRACLKFEAKDVWAELTGNRTLRRKRGSKP